jgi:hypothetical protein
MAHLSKEQLNELRTQCELFTGQPSKQMWIALPTQTVMSLIEMAQSYDADNFNARQLHEAKQESTLNLQLLQDALAKLRVQEQTLHSMKGDMARMLDYGAQIAAAPSSDEIGESEFDALIDYTNWRGKRKMYRIRPFSIFHGSNEYHDDKQWLLRAKDVGDGIVKTFAIEDIHSWHQI